MSLAPPLSTVAPIGPECVGDKFIQRPPGPGTLQIGGARKSTREPFVAGCVVTQSGGEGSMPDRGENMQVVVQGAVLSRLQGGL